MSNLNEDTDYNNQYNLVYADIQEVVNSHLSIRDKYIQFKYILERSCKKLTQEETIQFPSLFSRIVFLAQKFTLSRSLEWQLQNLRVKASILLRDEQNVVSEQEYETAKKTLIFFISVIYKKGVGEDYNLNNVIFPSKKEKNSSLRIRVQVIDVDFINKLITVQPENEVNKVIVKYGVENINDVFTPTINNLWTGAQLNLINYTIDSKTEYYIPQIIVLEPDYLIDASSLSECFQNYGKSYLHYFRRKFEINSNSKHILLGNLANYFLDELIYADNPTEIKFQDSFLNAFKKFPFEFTSCNDIKERSDFVEFMKKAQNQFNNIKRVVIDDFYQNNIDTEKCILEPSFFCETYGFQGRLDLLQLSDNEKETFKIIELKSGGLPYPKEDSSKIATNHEAQTTIYRLIIQSVFGKKSRDILSSILYSSSDNNGENIRYAASYQTLEKEIINIRNLIVATEYKLYTDHTYVNQLFNDILNLDNYGRVPQFFIDKIESLEKTIKALNELERKYLFRFISFVSRELYIQKIGDVDYDSNNGTASLWNTEFTERQDSYNLIAGLSIEEIDDSGEDMKILFHRKNDSEFVNFRIGELCVVYPRENVDDTILTNQILKGTIAYINNECVLVRFRYKQKNKNYLLNNKFWVIEHDRLDHGYNAMFKSLASFLKASTEKRSLLLGITPPKSRYKKIQNTNSLLSINEKQSQTIEKAMAADDYFLIVGPPGTGKTSIFARKLIELYHKQPDKNILIIAYTNRAVDELCDAIICALKNNNENIDLYIRIGTNLSCSPIYQNRLLQNISETVKSRDELRNIIQNCRIFVGTLASILGKPELFDIKKFDIAIIDEASQILEPQIIGLLPQFDKFIMIGDHKQLSTITLQNKQKSKVSEPELNSIELTDCSESYFERLFRICQKNNWSYVYDTLVYQGRMHNEILSFPNQYFYNNQLYIISDWQKEFLRYNKESENNVFEKIICSNRVAFINSTSSSNTILNNKINESEANITLSLTLAVHKLYKLNNLEFNTDKTLGIITPYRNQIALIRHKLESTNIPELNNIMVDTVERYQGSQRDIIIMSFCINKPYQLEYLSNLTKEQDVDRKLNVALTRVRHQLFLIGDEYLLRQNKIYRSLIDHIGVLHL